MVGRIGAALLVLAALAFTGCGDDEERIEGPLSFRDDCVFVGDHLVYMQDGQRFGLVRGAEVVVRGHELSIDAARDELRNLLTEDCYQSAESLFVADEVSPQ